MAGSVRCQYNLLRSFPDFFDPPFNKMTTLMHQEGTRDLPTPTIDIGG